MQALPRVLAKFAAIILVNNRFSNFKSTFIHSTLFERLWGDSFRKSWIRSNTEEKPNFHRGCVPERPILKAVKGSNGISSRFISSYRPCSILVIFDNQPMDDTRNDRPDYRSPAALEFSSLCSHNLQPQPPSSFPFVPCRAPLDLEWRVETYRSISLLESLINRLMLDSVHWTLLYPMFIVLHWPYPVLTWMFKLLLIKALIPEIRFPIYCPQVYTWNILLYLQIRIYQDISCTWICILDLEIHSKYLVRNMPVHEISCSLKSNDRCMFAFSLLIDRRKPISSGS